jgi:hypothetical protein
VHWDAEGKCSSSESLAGTRTNHQRSGQQETWILALSRPVANSQDSLYSLAQAESETPTKSSNCLRHDSSTGNQQTRMETATVSTQSHSGHGVRCHEGQHHRPEARHRLDGSIRRPRIPPASGWTSCYGPSSVATPNPRTATSCSDSQENQTKRSSTAMLPVNRKMYAVTAIASRGETWVSPTNGQRTCPEPERLVAPAPSLRRSDGLHCRLSENERGRRSGGADPSASEGERHQQNLRMLLDQKTAKNEISWRPPKTSNNDNHRRYQKRPPSHPPQKTGCDASTQGWTMSGMPASIVTACARPMSM